MHQARPQEARREIAMIEEGIRQVRAGQKSSLDDVVARFKERGMLPAERDLVASYAYYAERSESAAHRVASAIARAPRGLGRFPLMGKPGHYPGTREHIMTRYADRIVYEVNEHDQVVDVLRILHGAQQWPPAD